MKMFTATFKHTDQFAQTSLSLVVVFILTLHIFAPWRLCVSFILTQDGSREGAKPQRKTAK